MHVPRVSICVPNLNTARYLRECLDSALAQTFGDFEVVVVDNYSDDGSWEIIQEYALRDPRVRASQAPREGMYANWNNTIRLARGEFVYILTSDDTMLPQCLEKMVSALVNHPECGIAGCNLHTTDEEGTINHGAWGRYWPIRKTSIRWNQSHVRKPPHDFVHQCMWVSVHISITQLLIRKTVFDHIGLFRCDLGSEADVEWNMRAALIFDKIHVPEFLATWRRTKTQATQNTRLSDPEWPEMTRKMIGMAWSRVRDEIALPMRALGLAYFQDPMAYNAICLESQRARSLGKKLWRLPARILKNRNAGMRYVKSWLQGKANNAFETDEWRRNTAERLKLESCVILEPMNADET